VSQNNGTEIIKVGSRGLRKFQFDEESEIVILDVLHIATLWSEIDRSFRDDKGALVAGRTIEHMDKAVEFAAELLKVEKDKLSKADAFHFLKLIDDEGEKLKPFFEPASAVRPSSSAGSDVTYGT
jgi:hypothetical protein